MASLPCERDSLTLLLLMVVTFKKICFSLLCGILKRGLLRLRFEWQAPKPTGPCCAVQCPQADLKPPGPGRREAQAAAQAQAAGAAVPGALRLRRAGHRRAQLQRQ